jgi:hypothetical protein
MASLEEDVADRVFRLIESVMQLGVTRNSRCYDQALITDRIVPILDLARVVDATRANFKEGE